MPETGLTRPATRLEYLGPIGPAATPPGPVLQILDTVDIWLAGTLQSLFTLIKR